MYQVNVCLILESHLTDMISDERPVAHSTESYLYSEIGAIFCQRYKGLGGYVEDIKG